VTALVAFLILFLGVATVLTGYRKGWFASARSLLQYLYPTDEMLEERSEDLRALDGRVRERREFLRDRALAERFNEVERQRRSGGVAR
jgi:hypothetical protein